MKLQDVMNLVGQPEYWPLMIGGLLFVFVLVLFRRVGKLAATVNRDLAALYDAVDQLTDRFDRLPTAGFHAVPDADLESPCGDDTAPLTAAGLAAGMEEDAVMAESEEVLGEVLADSGPEAALADEHQETSVEEEPVDGFSFEAAADEEDDAVLAAAAAAPGLEEVLADEEPEALGGEDAVGGFSFEAAADEEDDAALAAAAVEPGLEEVLADEEPEPLGEEDAVGGFSFDAAVDEEDDAALAAAVAEPGLEEGLADEEPAALAEEEHFSFDAIGEEDEAALTTGPAEPEQEEQIATESVATGEPSEALGENQGADDFAFDGAAEEKDETVLTTAPTEPAVNEVFSEDAGPAQPETESREDRAGIAGTTSDALPDTQDQDEPIPDVGEQREAAPPAVDSGPASAMDEEVVPPEQQQSPKLVVLPGNPQRPEVALARCGQCGRKIAYPKRLSGKRVRCPSCKSGYVLP